MVSPALNVTLCEVSEHDAGVGPDGKRGPIWQVIAVAAPFFRTVATKVPLPLGAAVTEKLKLETVPPAATTSEHAVVLVLGVHAPSIEAYQVVALSGGSTC